MEGVLTPASSRSSLSDSSGGDPLLRLVQLIHLEDLELSRHRPGEELHRLRDPLDAADEGELLPGRAVPQLDAKPGLGVLEPRLGLQSVEVRQDEEDARLARIHRLLEAWFQHVLVVVSRELARGAYADDTRGHVVHPLDHYLQPFSCSSKACFCSSNRSWAAFLASGLSFRASSVACWRSSSAFLRSSSAAHLAAGSVGVAAG